MISENNQQFTKDVQVEKFKTIESSHEQADKQEILPTGIENYLSDLKKLENVSQADTSQALNLLVDSEADSSASFFKEKEAAINDIYDLDAEKKNLIIESEKAIQEPDLEEKAIDSPDSDMESSDLSKYIKLRQEQGALNMRELKVLAAVSYEKIKQHAASLGIEIGGLPEEKTGLKYVDYLNLGTYSTDSDEIKVDAKLAQVIIHEELHFAGAVDNRSGRKNLGDNRLSKTGFQSVWKAREGESEDRDLLRSFNEAVTEKMAREIFNNNKESIIPDIIKADPEIPKLNDELIEQEKSWALSELERNLPDKYKSYQENVFIKEYEMSSQSFEELAGEEKQKIESKFESEKFDVKSRDMLKEFHGYDREIKVLDAILEKLSQARVVQENISLDESRNKEWQDMQKAYLKGETIYLRRVEKIVGPNVLREFNAIDIRNVKNRKETDDSYQKKINDLLERINGS